MWHFKTYLKKMLRTFTMFLQWLSIPCWYMIDMSHLSLPSERQDPASSPLWPQGLLHQSSSQSCISDPNLTTVTTGFLHVFLSPGAHEITHETFLWYQLLHSLSSCSLWWSTELHKHSLEYGTQTYLEMSLVSCVKLGVTSVQWESWVLDLLQRSVRPEGLPWTVD